MGLIYYYVCTKTWNFSNWATNKKVSPNGHPHWVVGMPGHTRGCPVGQNGQKTLKYVWDIQIELEISQIGLLTRKLAPMGTPAHWVVGMPGYTRAWPGHAHLAILVENFLISEEDTDRSWDFWNRVRNNQVSPIGYPLGTPGYARAHPGHAQLANLVKNFMISMRDIGRTWISWNRMRNKQVSSFGHLVGTPGHARPYPGHAQWVNLVEKNFNFPWGYD